MRYERCCRNNGYGMRLTEESWNGRWNKPERNNKVRWVRRTGKWVTTFESSAEEHPRERIGVVSGGESVSFFFSSLHEPPSLVSRFNLSFLSLSFPPLSSISRVTEEEEGSIWMEKRHTGAGVVRDTIRDTKKSPGRLRVHKSRRIALSRWLPPRRRNDTPRDRRRMRRKGRESAMPVLCRVLRG